MYRSYQSNELLNDVPFSLFPLLLHSKHVLFLKQVHGISGLAVVDEGRIPASFEHEGDYIITSCQNLALGVVTADCLPIVVCDQDKGVVALVHAGWRGSVNGIVSNALRAMQKNFGTTMHNVSVFFGPSALTCCYEVDEKFLEPLRSCEAFDRVIQACNGRYFFDVPLYNEILLFKAGVKASQINRQFNECTICNENYCSYRRTKAPERNITAVVLHKK